MRRKLKRKLLKAAYIVVTLLDFLVSLVVIMAVCSIADNEVNTLQYIIMMAGSVYMGFSLIHKEDFVNATKAGKETDQERKRAATKRRAAVGELADSRRGQYITDDYQQSDWQTEGNFQIIEGGKNDAQDNAQDNAEDKIHVLRRM